ncbi:MAG: hypothetical protein GWN77_06005 [Gammaproteobacteria bacterium]|nr:hypothetical protein [Gammaproteobacteria bacterium]
MMTDKKSFSSRTIIDPRNIRKDIRRKTALNAKEIKKDGNVFDLKSMREFRDGAYRNYPGLANWWKLATRNTPDLVYELLRNKELRGPAWQLMKYVSDAHKKPTSRVPDAQVRNMAKLAEGLKKETRSRRLSIDCSRALSVLPLLKGKTVQQAMNVLSRTQPAHHPVEDSKKRRRIPRPKPVKRIKPRTK